MDERQQSRANASWSDGVPARGPWIVSRVEMVSTLARGHWPVARVELTHEKRGRIVEFGTGAGPVDAAFNAIAQILGVSAEVRSLEVQYQSPGHGMGLPTAAVEIEALVAGSSRCGRARTGDLLLSAIGAYLDAIDRAAAELGQTSSPAVGASSATCRWESWK